MDRSALGGGAGSIYRGLPQSVVTHEFCMRMALGFFNQCMDCVSHGLTAFHQTIKGMVVRSDNEGSVAL